MIDLHRAARIWNNGDSSGWEQPDNIFDKWDAFFAVKICEYSDKLRWNSLHPCTPWRLPLRLLSGLLLDHAHLWLCWTFGTIYICLFSLFFFSPFLFLSTLFSLIIAGPFSFSGLSQHTLYIINFWNSFTKPIFCVVQNCVLFYVKKKNPIYIDTILIQKKK